MAVRAMSEEELRALPAVMPLETAGKAWGLGRTKSYELARSEEFPCKVLTLGKRLKVTKAALFESLGLTLDGGAATEPEASDAA